MAQLQMLNSEWLDQELVGWIPVNLLPQSLAWLLGFGASHSLLFFVHFMGREVNIIAMEVHYLCLLLRYPCPPPQNQYFSSLFLEELFQPIKPTALTCLSNMIFCISFVTVLKKSDIGTVVGLENIF